MARVMTSIPGDGTSSVRTVGDTAGTRGANWPLIVGAVAAWLSITWLAGLRQGFLFVIGIGLGAVLAGVSFGFTTGWRAWIRDRDPTGFLAQLLTIGLAMAVSIPLIASHDELSGAIAPLSVSLLIGAFVFGAAMQVADGCGSGTLYKAGLGNGFSLAVLPGFVVGSFLGAAHLDAWLALGSLPPVSLPATLGTLPALALQLAVFTALAAFLWRRRGPRTDTRWRGRAIYIGAIAMAAFAVLNLLVAGQPWGIVYGLGLWGAKIATWLGADLSANAYWGAEVQQLRIHEPLLTDVTSVTNLGLLVGALLAANVRGTSCPQTRAAPKQWVAAVVAGLLLGYSSRLAFGCNVGAYFSGISTGSAHGWVWFAMAFLGSMLGVRLRDKLGLKA
jgi:uncharacterized membrane protein YedE/YeeE